MMRGGGRFSVALHDLQVQSGSRRASVSSNSTLNWKDEVEVSTSSLERGIEAGRDRRTQRLILGLSEPLLKLAGSSTRECKMIKAAFVW